MLVMSGRPETILDDSFGKMSFAHAKKTDDVLVQTTIINEI